MRNTTTLSGLGFLGLCLLLWAAPVMAQETPTRGNKVRTALRPATMTWPQKKKKKKEEIPTSNDAEANPKIEVKVDKTKSKVAKKDKKKAKENKPVTQAPKMAKKTKSKKGKSKKKKKSKKAPSTMVRVIGSYRPVDLRRRPGGKGASGPPAQEGLDLYLGMEKTGQLQAGQEFSVYRRVVAPTLKRAMITHKDGEVRVVGIEGAMAVARVLRTPIKMSHPYLKVPGVIVGDFVVATRPLDVARYEPPKPKRRAMHHNDADADKDAMAMKNRKRKARSAMMDPEGQARSLNTNSQVGFDAQAQDTWVRGQRKDALPWAKDQKDRFNAPGPGQKRKPLPEDPDSYKNWDR